MEKVGLTVGNLPARRGDRPRTHPVTPHEQLDQNAPREMQEALYERMRNLPGVVEGRSNVSLPTSRALHLDLRAGSGPWTAFMVGREFAHLHGYHDGSMHLALPPELRDEAIEKGWGELHPVAGKYGVPDTAVMTYGPRDEEELEIAWGFVEASYDYARGAWE